MNRKRTVRASALLAIGAALWGVGPAIAAPADGLAVRDDPFKPYVIADLEWKIRPDTGGFSYYCHGGGAYGLRAVVDRKSGSASFFLYAEIRSLRSTGRIESADLLGALELEQVQNEAANFNCYRNCMNDAVAVYAIPEATLAAIKARGSIPLRLQLTAARRCDVNTALTGPQVSRLEAWASDFGSKAASH